MKSYTYLAVIIFLCSSCVSLKQSNYVIDDIYFEDVITHNFNSTAMLNNKNVAMPDSIISYYDENEASIITPSFEEKLAAYEKNNAPTDYSKNQERSPSTSVFSTIGSSYAIGYGTTFFNNNSTLISPYNSFSPYYCPYTYSGAYYGAGFQPNYRPTSNRSPITVETKPYRPNVVNSRGQANFQNKPIRNITNTTKNNNRGYNSNSSRNYRTGSSGNNSRGVWSSPGYYNNSRNTGGSSRSSGTVQGVRRR